MPSEARRRATVRAFPVSMLLPPRCCWRYRVPILLEWLAPINSAGPNLTFSRYLPNPHPPKLCTNRGIRRPLRRKNAVRKVQHTIPDLTPLHRQSVLAMCSETPNLLVGRPLRCQSVMRATGPRYWPKLMPDGPARGQTIRQTGHRVIMAQSWYRVLAGAPDAWPRAWPSGSVMTGHHP